jgi:nitroreductase / dihydropteridine reductase
MNIIESLNWRYATKRMTGKKLPAQDLQTILDAIRLSASSYGLQPYNIVVVESEELRKQLQPLAYGQAQIIESSHVLVFCAWNSVDEAKVDEYLQAYSETTSMPIEKILAFGWGERQNDASHSGYATRRTIPLGCQTSIHRFGNWNYCSRKFRN